MGPLRLEIHYLLHLINIKLSEGPLETYETYIVRANEERFLKNKSIRSLYLKPKQLRLVSILPKSGIK
jgi:hypothetical protein